MMSSDHDHGHAAGGHSHGAAVRLDPSAKAVLERGLAELASLPDGLSFGATVSQRYPLPLARAVYGEAPSPRQVLDDVRRLAPSDPVAALEAALVLLELAETNQPAAAAAVPDDAAFLSECFRSKRLNGWIATLGDGDRGGLEAALAARWKFKFIPGDGPRTSLYVLLNMLARYDFVYGRIPAGDSHALGHFVEDFTPGVVIARGRLTDLEMTLVLAAMKLGVPAVVPTDFPFPLGRRVTADAIGEIVESVVVFPNIRRLLSFPDIPPLPDYLVAEGAEEVFDPAAGAPNPDASGLGTPVWGRTEFITCIGCSPFAPDHVCVLTPQRPPQCGRPYEMIKTGALYSYDDMSDIHHREAHAGINSFTLCPKGEPVDRATGEWSGVNAAVSRLSGGRTRRVQLHALGDAPHTGCGCFQLIMFRLGSPGGGIGVMERGYKGRSPDGRTWRDLHYDLGGKQAPGVAGAAPAYLRSGRFLAGEGGWAAVVWVSPKIAALMGEALPAGVGVGPQVD